MRGRKERASLIWAEVETNFNLRRLLWHGLAPILVEAARIGGAHSNAAILCAVLIVTELRVGTADGSLFQGGVLQAATLQVTLCNVVEVLETFEGGEASLAARAVGILLAGL